MFSKLSRYRKLPDTVTVDPDGRRLTSKSLRPLPLVTGQLQHLIEDRDRLDSLSQTYYRQPRKWWRICDANPEFLSPQALLGKEPVATYRLPLTFLGTGDPPWALLLRTLSNRVGVKDVRLIEEDRGIEVTFNRLNVGLGALANLIEAQHFRVEQPQQVGRIGKPIIIPPDIVT